MTIIIPIGLVLIKVYYSTFTVTCEISANLNLLSTSYVTKMVAMTTEIT